MPRPHARHGRSLPLRAELRRGRREAPARPTRRGRPAPSPPGPHAGRQRARSIEFIGRIPRPDGVTPLSDEDIRRLAPSALATEAHESRSDRYAYIPTAEVIRAMRANGFLPMAAAQARARDAGRAGHAKHMLRFRNADARPLAERRVGQVFPEIVLLNSHDGASAYRVMFGVSRLICLNGMVMADRRGAEVRVPHKGDVVRRVVEGGHAVLDDARRALDAAEAWRGVILSRDEQRAFGEAARLLRFGDGEGNAATPIAPERLLAPRRRAGAPPMRRLPPRPLSRWQRLRLWLRREARRMRAMHPGPWGGPHVGGS